MKKAPACLITDATYALWERLAAFPAGETDAALRCLMEWLAREIDADNVVWIGAVRALRGARAKKDDPRSSAGGCACGKRSSPRPLPTAGCSAATTTATTTAS